SKCSRWTVPARYSSSVNGRSSRASTSSRVQSWRRLTDGMGDPRRLRRGKPGSLETMPDPVNQIHVRPVDGAVARLGRSLWPARCLLCNAGGALGQDLCVACAAALPWARLACPRCALPLSSPARACGACLRKSPLLDAAHAAFTYRPPIDRL